jgi:hypothetical protein
MKMPIELNMPETAIAPKTRLQAALALAIIADAVQIIGFPLFVEGAASPVDDLVDLGMAGMLSLLLGWHWEFLPSFAAKLVPGVDLVPLWTLAVANVYRKSKKLPKKPETIEGQFEQPRPGGDLRT